MFCPPPTLPSHPSLPPFPPTLPSHPSLPPSHLPNWRHPLCNPLCLQFHHEAVHANMTLTYPIPIILRFDRRYTIECFPHRLPIRTYLHDTPVDVPADLTVVHVMVDNVPGHEIPPHCSVFQLNPSRHLLAPLGARRHTRRGGSGGMSHHGRSMRSARTGLRRRQRQR